MTLVPCSVAVAAYEWQSQIDVALSVPDRTAYTYATHEWGGPPMSEAIVAAEPRVTWPSNAISEVPFRVYTDAAQYQREQECIFKGAHLALFVPRGGAGEAR